MSKVSASYTIRMEWDSNAKVWRCSSEDIIGLNMEARTMADLLTEAADIIPRLMELNGQPCPSGSPELPVCRVCTQPDYCRAQAQCSYTKTDMVGPDGDRHWREIAKDHPR